MTPSRWVRAAVVCCSIGAASAAGAQGLPAFVSGADEGAELLPLGHAAREKVSADQTGGAYYAFTVESPPGTGIPPHIHSLEDEVVYVAVGEYEVVLGDKTMRVGPGAVLNLARGTAHGFTNIGPDTGVTFWMVLPGESFQGFFRELAQVPPGPPNPAALAELFGRYGMELLPPPG